MFSRGFLLFVICYLLFVFFLFSWKKEMCIARFISSLVIKFYICFLFFLEKRMEDKSWYLRHPHL